MSTLRSDLKRGWGSRIARRFVLSTVLCSSILALVITSIQLYADYRSDVSALNRDLVSIESSRLPSLIESVWSIDETLIGSQLQGILQIEGVRYVAITGNDSLVEFGEDGDFAGRTDYRYPMTRIEGSREFHLGDLYIVISLDHVYESLIAKGVTLLVANSIKTFLVALFIIFIFHMMIGRHLARMAHFARKYDPENPSVRLNLGRRTDIPDELSDLEIAFNQWISSQESYQTRQQSDHQKIASQRDALSASNEKLNRANEELNQFAYSASHDLKAPLTSIVGLLGFAEKDVESGQLDQVLFSIRHSKDEAQRLAERIEDMLTLAKSEQGSNTWEEVDVNIMVESIWRTMQTAYPEKESVLTTCFEHDIPPVLNKVRIQLIFENILSNALKYASEKRDIAHVSVHSYIENQNFVITISDNGMGIPEKFHDRVFQVFQRFANSPKPSSGLGLAIVKKNVNQMGGDISFTSTSEGTMFKIVLPQHESALANAS